MVRHVAIVPQWRDSALALQMIRQESGQQVARELYHGPSYSDGIQGAERAPERAVREVRWARSKAATQKTAGYDGPRTEW